jgi:cytoskeletal protein RodZ
MFRAYSDSGCNQRTAVSALKERTLITRSEMQHRLFMLVLASAIVFAMSGWVYALEWVALKLIQFV